MLQIQIDKKTMKRFKKFIAPKEMKFVAALTLTNIAGVARDLLRDTAEREWTVRKRGAITGFSMSKAGKRDLVSVVGHFDWYAEQQTDEKQSNRQPLTSENLAIPLPGVKRTKTNRIAKKDKLQNVINDAFTRDTGVFITPIKGGKSLIRRRDMKTQQVVNLYLLVPKQLIKPKFSLLDDAEKAAGFGQKIFNRNIEKHRPR